MSVVTDRTSGESATLQAGSSHPNRPYPRLDEAITRSQAYLLSEQKPAGYWVGELIVDVTLVADMVAFYHWWGKVNLEWERRAINQRPTLWVACRG